jgi:hypothetical protein
MRGIPIIFALTVGGAVYADAFNIIEPHWPTPPHHKRTSVEIDLTDSPKETKELGEFVATQDIEWIADIKKATALADSSEDIEEKRLFWHTVWSDDPVAPQVSWADPNLLIYPVVTVTQAPGTAGIGFRQNDVIVETHEFVGEISPPQPVFMPLGGTIGGIKVLQTFQMDDVFPKQVDDICIDHPTLPECVIDKKNPVVPITIIGTPVNHPDPIVSNPTPIITGPISVGPVSAGTVPEPSTWAMMIIGFLAIAWKVANARNLRNNTNHRRA